MLCEQDKRAIETMAYCGSDVKKLCLMFPEAEESDIVEIWERINQKRYADENKKMPTISCNCS